MSYVIGIDTGGTFTDAFVADESGRLAAAKTPSTPPNFAEGFLNGIDKLAAELRPDLLRQRRPAAPLSSRPLTPPQERR